MERKRREKSKYEHVIETNRDDMNFIEMEVFLLLDEGNTIKEISLELDMLEPEIIAIIESYIPRKTERLSKSGEPYKKRLTDAAIIAILANHEDLTEDEKKILTSLVGARNQVVAALSIEMNPSAFIKEFKRIRGQHGF